MRIAPHLAALAVAAVFALLIDDTWTYVVCALLMFAEVLFAEWAAARRVRIELSEQTPTGRH